MKIFVKTLTGKVYNLECESADTIAHLKAKVHAIKGIPLHEHWITFGGNRLDIAFSDKMTLADVGVQKGSLLHLFVRLTGGAGGEIERPRRPEHGYLYYADAFKYGWREEDGKVLLHLLLELCQDGTISDGIITRPMHGFGYKLD